MYQATTPTITLTFPSTSATLTSLGDCLVTVMQGGVTVEVEPTVNAHSLYFTLTQEQTSKFKTGAAFVQANFTKSDGTRTCSTVVEAHIDTNLHNEVIEND